MVRDHRLAERRRRARLRRGPARRAGVVAGRLGRQARLVEQLVALQHPLLVPWRAIQREGQPGPRTAPLCLFASRRGRPPLQRRPDGGVQHGGAAAPPVLPGEEACPGRPQGVGGVGVDGAGREGQIADRDHPRGIRAVQGPRAWADDGPHVGHRRVAAAVAEGVELLHITDLEPGLLGHEGAQGQLEGAPSLRIERSERQADQGRWPRRARIVRTHGQHHRLVLADRHDHGRQPDDDGGGHPCVLRDACCAGSSG